MIQPDIFLPLFLVIPFGLSIVTMLLPTKYKLNLRICLLAVLSVLVLSIIASIEVMSLGPIRSRYEWLYVDALSVYHLIIMSIVFVASTFYSIIYFGHEIKANTITPQAVSRFCTLWLLAFASMTLVLLSNNIGMIWVGVETTSLLTTFLICIHKNRQTVEAMWKYLIICSVGVAFALIGTMLIGVSAQKAGPQIQDLLLWTNLNTYAQLLNPTFVKAGFIFILVGYGTKAGLAPMHTWLPDAHSQAPGPVSAMFSGFMLSMALYCIMRFIPIVEVATGKTGWALNQLVVFGFLSIVIATAFLFFQTDIKRLLAYSSVEHIGIIALALGLGPLGNFVALFHTLNHSLCKSLSFMAAGRLGQFYKTHNIDKITNSMNRVPFWGAAMFAGFFALIGMVPFPIFMSKIQLIRALILSGHWWWLTLFVLATVIIFLAILRYAISIAWKRGGEEQTVYAVPKYEAILVIAMLLMAVTLGLTIPDGLSDLMNRAALIISGNRGAV